MSDRIDPLWLVGYAVLPPPRRAELAGGFVPFTAREVDCGAGVESDDVAVTALGDGVAGLDLPAAADGPLAVRLSIDRDAVGADAPAEVADQAYRLTIAATGVELVGAGPAGLYYGVQTLLQLLDGRGGADLKLPAGVIVDWPRVERRIVHLDTKHHQDRFETFMALIRRWAEFKINAVAWEIEDKFAYQGHPEIGAPGAFTAEQVKQIVAEARRHYVEIIPILQGPSHMAYVLKHPSLAHLRETPTNNYMICPTRKESWDLIFEMYDEILDATEGCKYFFIGTDEAYYLGDGVECGCAARAKEVGPSGIFCDFVNKAADHARARGRTPLCWAEYPLEEKDLPKMPKDIVDGIGGGGQRKHSTWWKTEDELGIRRLVYSPTQGSRVMFPGYFYSEAAGDSPDLGGRVADIIRTSRRGLEWPAHGTFTAAWDDSGLHNETFWLGWATGASCGWNPDAVDPELLPVQFMRLFHGPRAAGMVEAYRLLDLQARFWATGWDCTAAVRGYAFMKQWHERHDYTLSMPNVPDVATLNNRPFFAAQYAARLAEARVRRAESDRLITLLLEKIVAGARNAYNLEVLLAIARFCRHHIELLLGLEKTEGLLDAARGAACRGEYKAACRQLDAAADLVENLAEDGQRAFEQYRLTYEKSCYPKGRSVGGRQFVHIMDDTKDHRADRRADLTFMMEREESLDLSSWVERLRDVAAKFAAAHANDSDR